MERYVLELGDVGQFRVMVGTHADLAGLHELTVRATVMKDGKYPVVAETRVLVLISPR